MSEDRIIRRWKWIFFGIITISVAGFFGAKYVSALRTWPTEERLALGKEIFEREWTVHDPMAGKGDGLGPVFNEKSCVACHFQGGVGGAGPSEFNVTGFEVLPNAGGNEDVFGGVVHKFATNDTFEEDGAKVNERFPPIKGGTRIVNGCEYAIPEISPVMWSNVNTPPLFGLGLIDKMSGRSIAINGLSRTADSMNRTLDGDFSSVPVGRVRTVSGGRVGRFGWKGQFATLRDFVAAACAVELGLSNPGRAQNVPNEYVPNDEAEYDINAKQLNALVCFVENLPRPEQVLPQDPDQRKFALHGEGLFAKVGCAECHTPDIGGIKGVYSDFRLYDVDDQVRQSGYDKPPKEFELPLTHPRPNEWKTPPLWGVADSAPYFHDGASPSIMSAIMRHGSQAEKSRKKFEKLVYRDQKAIVAFLDTLRAPQVLTNDEASDLASTE